jgi:SagB-type dehydrogenase family enzyme
MNGDTSAAREYHTATNHSLQSVRTGPHGLDWANQPRPYKLYAAELPDATLPTDWPASSMPALTALATVEAPSGESRVPDARTLAKLLHYSAGVTRTLRFDGGSMAFRAAACTGALYHIELYVVCGDLDGLAAGVYQFAAQDDSLRRLRSGDYRAALVEATGNEPAVVDAPVVIVYTTTFWRNAWKYQSRAYRHAFWDSGTIIANTLAVAAAEDLPARVVTGFADSDVNRLIDVDPQREASIGLVTIGHDTVHRASPASSVEALQLPVQSLSHHEVDYPLIRQMHTASSLDSAADVRAWRKGRPQAGSMEAGISIPTGRGTGDPDEAVDAVIRRRGSSRRLVPSPIDADSLLTILDVATRGIPADYHEQPSDALSEPYLIVNRVDGLQPGSYRFDLKGRSLEELKAGDFVEEAGYLDLGQALAADAAVDVYFLADLEAVLGSLGNRGYRVAQLDAAIMAGKMYLAAYALGLGATGLTFFDDDVIEFFSPRARGLSVMFLLAIGIPQRRVRQGASVS